MRLGSLMTVRLACRKSRSHDLASFIRAWTAPDDIGCHQSSDHCRPMSCVAANCKLSLLSGVQTLYGTARHGAARYRAVTHMQIYANSGFNVRKATGTKWRLMTAKLSMQQQHITIWKTNVTRNSESFGQNAFGFTT
jgi:hypothetical protein